MVMTKRRYHCWQSAAILFADAAIFLLCISVVNTDITFNLDFLEPSDKIEMILEENLKLDKGKGCVIPWTNPYSPAADRIKEKSDVIKCPQNKDMVKCDYSNCRIVTENEYVTGDILCEIQDIIYHSDAKYTLGPTKVIFGDESYKLNLSDHIKVTCYETLDQQVKWSGNTVGFREIVPKKPSPGRENTYNVVIFGFDSASRNGFIRRMPKSWDMLTEELGAVVMEGYNIVGSATPAAIIPILTGHTELELPDARKDLVNSQNVDAYPFIFYKLKEDGANVSVMHAPSTSQNDPWLDHLLDVWTTSVKQRGDRLSQTIDMISAGQRRVVYRTAYFEDMPHTGTFQWRLNGWRHQPTDHYLRPFFIEEGKKKIWYCVGDTPQYQFMMDITKQFMTLGGKRFVFTFSGDITHDDFNMVQVADEDMAEFLETFKSDEPENTLLVVMGDHGPRSNNKARFNTTQGQIEERQPLMALRLPEALVRDRPDALAALQANTRSLTTPHDLHATLLDVLGMRQHSNPYRVPGADLQRGLTMLEPIPRNRSCSEAGIEFKWCACVGLRTISQDYPLD